MEGGHTYNTQAHVQYRDADANVDVYNGRQGVTQGGPRTVHLQHITTAERAAKVAQGRRRGRVHNQGGREVPLTAATGTRIPGTNSRAASSLNTHAQDRTMEMTCRREKVARAGKVGRSQGVWVHQ